MLYYVQSEFKFAFATRSSTSYKIARMKDSTAQLANSEDFTVHTLLLLVRIVTGVICLGEFANVRLCVRYASVRLVLRISAVRACSSVQGCFLAGMHCTIGCNLEHLRASFHSCTSITVGAGTRS